MSESRTGNAAIQYGVLIGAPLCLFCGILCLVGMPDAVQEDLKATPQPTPKSSSPQNLPGMTDQELGLCTATPFISDCAVHEKPITLGEYFSVWKFCESAPFPEHCAQSARLPGHTADEFDETVVGQEETICIHPTAFRQP